MSSSPPHIVIHSPGGVRDEVTFEPPDIWNIKHVGPEYDLPGSVPPCTVRLTTHHRVTTDEIAARYSKEMP
jgi:hypothetical protein